MRRLGLIFYDAQGYSTEVSQVVVGAGLSSVRRLFSTLHGEAVHAYAEYGTMDS